ncbi:MAG: type IV pilus assembly protein PilM [Prosthecobacter sp.]|jgi:type IV pilus assembly protein PilM|nr:type IV pilus assembly protein PilM [Prosthecobacter sp.]
MADSKSIAVLNLGSQRLSGAIFSRSGGDLVLKKYEFVDMAGDPTVDATRIPQLKVGIQELAARLKLKSSSVWYAVAGHTVFSRFVKLPPVQDDRVAQIVEFEARQNVPFPINEVVWDYEFSSEGGVETEVVIVAMKSDALDEIDDQVAQAKIATSGVDVAPLALYNAFRYSYPDVDEPCVLIDLGARSTNMVFIEPGRFFIRNFLVGGASITSAVGKEFSIGFAEAETQKIHRGFIAPGGAVMDHDDPEIAALSKVIRNAASNLHTQVMRTITFYRSQQGGSQPKRVFITGGGALLGNMVSFLEEKLKLPVEVFNPLRGVQVDRGVKADVAAADAPFLGELVGLALRSSGGTPCEVELQPTKVRNARDAARRMPALIFGMLLFWAAFATGIYHYQNTERVTREKLSVMNAENNRLKTLAANIANLETQQAQYAALSRQLEQAVAERSFWVRLLTDLNAQFDNDMIWLTLVEPLKNGKSITPQLLGQGESSGDRKDDAAPAAPTYSLRMQGLYRKNEQGEQIVYKYASALAKLPWFDIADFEDKRAEFVSAQSGVEEDRHAYTFKIELPLKQTMNFKD